MSTVTREQLLREVGVEVSNSGTPVSRMKPGTLALCGDAGTTLMLVKRDGVWGTLFDGSVTTSAQFDTAYPSRLGTLLFTDIPADAWSRICNEPSHVKRVRIARVAVGLPPSEVELTEAAGLAEPPALVKISTTPAGTLLVRGDQLVLMQDRGRWAWFTSGYEYSDAHFNSAGFRLEGLARVLVTGIAETAWPDLRRTASNLERVRIAVAAGTVSDGAPAPPAPASAPTPAVVTPAPEVTGELPGVSQEMLDELSLGLFDPRVHINAGLAAATVKNWLTESPSALRALLSGDAGIECDNHQVWNDGVTHEKWRASVLFAGHTPDHSIFVRSLESMTPREVAISLLKATPMRRLHAHAWLHRGVLARLRTWTSAGSDSSDEMMLDAALYEGKTRDTWFVYPGGLHGRLAGHPGIRINIPEVLHQEEHDDSWTFGRTLRQVTIGLWAWFKVSHTSLPAEAPRSWLAEDTIVEANSDRPLSYTVLRQSLAAELRIEERHIHLRHVKTPCRGPAQAPIGLKMVGLEPGRSLLLETAAGLGSQHRRESLAAWLLRVTRTDHVHLTETWNISNWTSLSMPKPRTERKTP